MLHKCMIHVPSLPLGNPLWYISMLVISNVLSPIVFLIPSHNTIGYQICYLISTFPDNCSKKQVSVSVQMY